MERSWYRQQSRQRRICKAHPPVRRQVEETARQSDGAQVLHPPVPIPSVATTRCAKSFCKRRNGRRPIGERGLRPKPRLPEQNDEASIAYGSDCRRTAHQDNEVVLEVEVMPHHPCKSVSHALEGLENIRTLVSATLEVKRAEMCVLSSFSYPSADKTAAPLLYDSTRS